MFYDDDGHPTAPVNCTPADRLPIYGHHAQRWALKFAYLKYKLLFVCTVPVKTGLTTHCEMENNGSEGLLGLTVEAKKPKKTHKYLVTVRFGSTFSIDGLRRMSALYN